MSPLPRNIPAFASALLLALFSLAACSTGSSVSSTDGDGEPDLDEAAAEEDGMELDGDADAADTDDEALADDSEEPAPDGDLEPEPDGDEDGDVLGDETEHGDSEEADPPARSFYLSAAPFQIHFEPFSAEFVFKTDGFDGLIDLLSVHQDFFGLPWDAFADGADPPAAWQAVMEDIRDQTQRLGVGVFLSVTPLDGDRRTLIARVRETEDGQAVKDERWAADCYDFGAAPDAARLRTAYKNYVRWMVDFFEPRFLNHLIEVNIFARSCPAPAYDALMELANEVYGQEKERHPELIVFPSFMIGEYWGWDEGYERGDATWYETAYARDGNLRRDRFAISSYTAFDIYWGGPLPADFYTYAYDHHGEPTVFAEVGTASRSVICPYPTLSDPCTTLLATSEAEQQAYMAELFDAAQTMGSDLVTWWSLRDYLPADLPGTCPCEAEGLWCEVETAFDQTGLLPLFLMWGSMGILDYEGDGKTTRELWEEWLGRRVGN